MTLYLLFSHQLTPQQIQDAQENWHVERFIYLPKDLLELWNNIPPDLSSLRSYIDPILSWLVKNANKNDLLLVQGDYGATCLVVQFALEKELKPIYSTTKREVEEIKEKDGSIHTKRRFLHQRFRLYEKY